MPEIVPLMMEDHCSSHTLLLYGRWSVSPASVFLLSPSIQRRSPSVDPALCAPRLTPFISAINRPRRWKRGSPCKPTHQQFQTLLTWHQNHHQSTTNQPSIIMYHTWPGQPFYHGSDSRIIHQPFSDDHQSYHPHR